MSVSYLSPGTRVSDSQSRVKLDMDILTNKLAKFLPPVASESMETIENEADVWESQGVDHNVVVDWEQPCEAAFEHLAKVNPIELVAWIDSNILTPPDLTYAAEALGAVTDFSGIYLTLLQLLDSVHPTVREGALYGLSNLLDEHGVRERLLQLAREDESPVLREIAQDILGI